MKIGDRVFVHGYIDEIRKDTVIIRNNGGYFGTVPSEVIVGELPSVQPRKGKWIRTRTLTHDGELYCNQCEQEHPEQKIIWNFCPNCGCRMEEGDSE